MSTPNIRTDFDTVEFALVLYIDFLLPSMNSGVFYQKQVSKAGTSEYIPQILRDVITCPCLWSLLCLCQNTPHHCTWYFINNMGCGGIRAKFKRKSNRYIKQNHPANTPKGTNILTCPMTLMSLMSRQDYDRENCTVNSHLESLRNTSRRRLLNKCQLPIILPNG